MLFKDKVRLVADYEKWLKEVEAENNFKPKDCYINFLNFLQTRDLLKDTTKGYYIKAESEDICG